MSAFVRFLQRWDFDPLKHTLVVLLAASSCRVSVIADDTQAICRQVIDTTIARHEAILEEDARNECAFYNFTRLTTWKDEDYASVVTLPGTGMLLLCHATRLKMEGVHNEGITSSKDEQLARCNRIFRWICLTHQSNGQVPFVAGRQSEIKAGEYWDRPQGFRADILGYANVAFMLLKDELPDETVQMYETLCATCRSDQPITAFNPRGGGNHDLAKHELSTSLIDLLGGNQDGHRQLRSLIGMMSKPSSRTAGEPINWNNDRHLFPDHSSHHHGRDSVWYGADMLFEGFAYVAIAERLYDTEPILTKEDRTNIAGVFQRLRDLVIPNGAVAHIHGSEYDSYYGAAMLPLAFATTYLGESTSESLRNSSAQILRQHFLAEPEYDYHKAIPAKACLTLLLHNLYDNNPGSNSEIEFGVFQRPWQKAIIYRQPRFWNSVSLGSETHWKPGHGVGIFFCADVPLAAQSLCTYFREYGGVGRISTRNLFAPIKGHQVTLAIFLVLASGACGLAVSIVPAKWRSGALKYRRTGICLSGLGVIATTVVYTDYYEPRTVSSTPVGTVVQVNANDGGFTAEGEIKYRDVAQHILVTTKDEQSECTITIKAVSDCDLTWEGVPFSFINPFSRSIDRRASEVLPDDKRAFDLPNGLSVRFASDTKCCRLYGRSENWARTESYCHQIEEWNFGGVSDLSLSAGDSIMLTYTVSP